MKAAHKFSSPIFLLNLLILVSAFLYLSGGGFLLQGHLRLLIDQKPWIHRLILSSLAAIGFVSAFLVLDHARKTNANPGFFLAALNKFDFSTSRWVWFLFFISAGIWGTSASLRHEAFQSSFDMAIFTQAIWNTAHGAWFYSSIKGGINLLGDHFSPVLALLAVPYRIWPNPHLILWIQTLAAASCLFPLHALAFRHLTDKSLIFPVLLAFFLYLPVRNAVRFDFHPEILSMPLFLWAYYFLEDKKTSIASILLLFAIITKEGAAIAAAGIGFYSFFFFRLRKFGLLWMMAGCVYFIGITQWIIPHVFKTDYFYLASNYLAWGSHGGMTAFSKHIFSASTISYFVKIFLPLSFASLFDSSVILTFPALAQNLFARNEMARSIFFQYTAFLTPFVFISAIKGLAKIKHPHLAARLLLISTIVMGGVSELYVIQVTREQSGPELDSIKGILRTIPAEASVRTHEFLAPHLANRRELHIYENTHPLEGGSFKALNSDYVVLTPKMLGEDRQQKLTALEAGGYSLSINDPNIKIYKHS